MQKSLKQNKLKKKLESIFQEIFALEKRKNLGIFGMVANFAHNHDKKILHILELKEQIYSCRESMKDIYGQKIVEEIEKVPIKYRKSVNIGKRFNQN